MTAEIRELLELAAQSIGVTLDFNVRGDFPPYYINERGGHSSWNPLTSSDDLIDLMDKRSIDPRWNKDYVTAFIYDESKFVCETLEYFAYHPTRKAALAMAVLRCAAEYQRRKG